MLNLAGPTFDYGNVVFAVLQECEHRRGALTPDLAPEPPGGQAGAGPHPAESARERATRELADIAREKLAEIRTSYDELGGTPPYWQELEREVFGTVVPQYAAAAIEKTRLEQASYDLWRRGDPAARAAFALGALVVGGIIVKLPFVPIFEDAFAFGLAACGLFYPEIKRLIFDFRYTRGLNRLVAQADRYQKDRRLHFVSQADLDRELEALGADPATAAAHAKPSDRARQAERGLQDAALPPPAAARSDSAGVADLAVAAGSRQPAPTSRP